MPQSSWVPCKGAWTSPRSSAAGTGSEPHAEGGPTDRLGDGRPASYQDGCTPTSYSSPTSAPRSCCREASSSPWPRSGEAAGVVLDSWTVSPEAGAGPTRFLFLGRLVPLKGVDLLLEAFASVTERVDAVLEIAGDGPQRLELQGQIATLGLGERVELSGWLDRAQIREHLAASTVFVFPSIHEAGGTVVLEAMASGRPVIAADWGGPADVLDESCGILVDVSAWGQFVDGLAAAMEPPPRGGPRASSPAGRGRTRADREGVRLRRWAGGPHARPLRPGARVRPEEPHVTPSDPARDAYDGWPSVSAVVCTRDRPELLRKAIAAILGQDYEGRIECIVVFDKSEPDQTLVVAGEQRW